MRNLPVWIFSSLLALMLTTSLTPLIVQGHDAPSIPIIDSPAQTQTHPQTITKAATQAADTQITRGERSQLVCTLSSFLSFDPVARIAPLKSLNGRGLLSCRNENGFKTEYPVLADLNIDMQVPASATFYSLDSRPFVVPREIGQIQDVYKSRSSGEKIEKEPLLHGRANELVISLKVTSHQASEAPLHITSLRLRFDESAPDLF